MDLGASMSPPARSNTTTPLECPLGETYTGIRSASPNEQAEPAGMG